MKKLLLVVLVAVMAMGSGYAQREQRGQRDPAARLQKEIDNLTTELGLSKDQVAQVTPIIAESQKKQSEAFAKMREGGGDVDREQMRDQAMKLRAETDMKLKEVLTKEQFVKLRELRKKQMEERTKRVQQQ
jgi:Spy/CpxP family protein refolding chaperone